MSFRAFTAAALVTPLLLVASAPALAGPEDLDSVLDAWPAWEPSIPEREAATVEPDAPLLYSVPRPEEEPGDWAFFVAVYGWLAGVEGDVVRNGSSTGIDIPFHDLADAAKAGFMGYAEARYREWFLAFDGTWATLRGDREGRILALDVTVDQRTFDLRIGRNALRRKLGDLEPGVDPIWRREVVLDLFVGARYWDTKTTIETKVVGRKPKRITTREDRWDPFLGFRFGYDFATRWLVAVRGDVGGFGIGDAAEFAWQAGVNVGFRATSAVVVFAGYRAMGSDLVTGRGADRNGADLVQHGPTIGIGFLF